MPIAGWRIADCGVRCASLSFLYFLGCALLFFHFPPMRLPALGNFRLILLLFYVLLLRPLRCVFRPSFSQERRRDRGPKEIVRESACLRAATSTALRLRQRLRQHSTSSMPAAKKLKLNDFCDSRWHEKNVRPISRLFKIILGFFLAQIPAYWLLASGYFCLFHFRANTLARTNTNSHTHARSHGRRGDFGEQQSSGRGSQKSLKMGKKIDFCAKLQFCRLLAADASTSSSSYSSSSSSSFTAAASSTSVRGGGGWGCYGGRYLFFLLFACVLFSFRFVCCVRWVGEGRTATLLALARTSVLGARVIAAYCFTRTLLNAQRY